MRMNGFTVGSETNSLCKNLGLNRTLFLNGFEKSVNPVVSFSFLISSATVP